MEPENGAGKLNEHVKRHFYVLATGSVLFGVLWWVLVEMLWWLSAADPTGRQIRYLAAKASASITGEFVVLWTVLFLELITNGSLFGKILKTSVGCALFGSAMALVAGLIFIYV